MNHLLSESLVFARRNLEHVRQLPEKLLDVTLQPIMFTLLFAYVFGGVIAISDGSYREYLIAGVLIQSLAFGMMGPASSIATDLREGVIDRFRTLPITRSAYLVGHVLAEVGALSIAVIVLSLSGLIVGWRIHSGFAHAAAAYGLVLVFSIAMVWLGTYLGLIVRTPDAVQGVAFVVVFPLTFLASTFVPIDGLPHVLAIIASWNPISAMTAAVRELFGNPVGMPANPAWPLRHAIVATLGWCALIIGVSVPLALQQYRRRTTG
jgi:ABC transporter DrrB family efflux protein